MTLTCDVQTLTRSQTKQALAALAKLRKRDIPQHKAEPGCYNVQAPCLIVPSTSHLQIHSANWLKPFSEHQCKKLPPTLGSQEATGAAELNEPIRPAAHGIEKQPAIAIKPAYPVPSACLHPPGISQGP